MENVAATDLLRSDVRKDLANTVVEQGHEILYLCFFMILAYLCTLAQMFRFF